MASERGLISILIFILLALFLPLLAMGHDPLVPEHSCADHLSGRKLDTKIHIFGSGRDDDMRLPTAEAAKTIYEIALNLGLVIPSMHIRHADDGTMLGMTGGTGWGHPAPNAHDGQSILRGLRRGGSILEVVFPGDPYHHQYVRDTNSLHDTLLIYAHVAGHIDFAEVHPLLAMRGSDPIPKSMELSLLMSNLFHKEGHKEVTEFYQFLLSTAMLQDVIGGTFEHPNDFHPRAKNRPATVHGDRPARASRSFLQAMVHNLPADTPEWKLEMIRLFEEVRRPIGRAVLTKWSNEGWATFLEYIILSYLPGASSDDSVRFAELQQGVRQGGISNPYWMGSELWLRLWDRFCEQPTNQALSPLERDRKFIQYAHQVMQDHPTDYHLIRYALDRHWVEKQNLLLYRIQREQIDRQTGKITRVNQAISRDPKRVINAIATQIANPYLKLPDIVVADLNHERTGTVLLKHRPMYDLPLKRSTIAKTLFVLAQILERPVAIETIGSGFWKPSLRPIPVIRGLRGRPIRPDDDFRPPTLPFHGTYPIKVQVDAKGRVTVSISSDHVKQLPDQFEKKLQWGVDAFKANLALSYPIKREKEARPIQDIMKSLSTIMMGGHASHVPEVVQAIGRHAPTTSQAIWEYLNTSKYRIAKLLRMMVRGETPVVFGPNGRTVRIKGALPPTPQFALDYSILEKRKPFLPPTPPPRIASIPLGPMAERISRAGLCFKTLRPFKAFRMKIWN